MSYRYMTISPHRRIACVHLYDDYSGATNVFAQVLSLLNAAGHDLSIIIANVGEPGFVRSRWPVTTVPYAFHHSKKRAALSYLYSQTVTFFKVLRLCLFQRNDLVYVSTILPAGAILAGWLCRRQVIVHSHEVGMGTQSLFTATSAVARRFATKILCVSQFVADKVAWPFNKTTVIPNSLDEQVWAEARIYGHSNLDRKPSHRFRCAMACSLRIYKGLDSFLELADLLPEVDFELIVNCKQSELTEFINATLIPSNVSIVRRPTSVLHHFAQADLVLNLSHADSWIETFGMTLLEAMACGVPVIAPKVGGCIGLFEHGRGGWHIDSRDLTGLSTLIRTLEQDPVLHSQSRRFAFNNAESFSPESFSRRIAAAFDGK